MVQDAQPQEIITNDNLNASVDAQVYFKVKSDEDSVKSSQYNVNNYQWQIVNLARTTLRNIIGTLTLKSANSERDRINQELLTTLSKETQNWGMEIVRTELKEIDPPKDVQETMNKVVKAENEKIAALVPAGQGPDVGKPYYGWVPLWKDSGFILPLPEEAFPPKRFERTGFPEKTSIFIPGPRVFTAEITSAPWDSTSLAINFMSTTLGVSFTITGMSVDFFTARVIFPAVLVLQPKGLPNSVTLGQEMLISKASMPGSPSSLLTIFTYSSGELPATLTITAVFKD